MPSNALERSSMSLLPVQKQGGAYSWNSHGMYLANTYMPFAGVHAFLSHAGQVLPRYRHERNSLPNELNLVFAS